MDVPLKIPTDNLYKFMAIFGITLLIVSAFTFIKTGEQIEEKMLRLEWDSGKLLSEYNHFNSETDKNLNDVGSLYNEVDKNTEEVEQMHENVKVSNEEATIKLMKLEEASDILGESKKQLDRANLILSNIGEKSEKLEKKRVNFWLKREIADRKIYELNAYKQLSIIGFFIGLFLLASGGYLWYSRLQKYLDLKVKEEAS